MRSSREMPMSAERQIWFCINGSEGHVLKESNCNCKYHHFWLPGGPQIPSGGCCYTSRHLISLICSLRMHIYQCACVCSDACWLFSLKRININYSITRKTEDVTRGYLHTLSNQIWRKKIFAHSKPAVSFSLSVTIWRLQTHSHV